MLALRGVPRPSASKELVLNTPWRPTQQNLARRRGLASQPYRDRVVSVKRAGVPPSPSTNEQGPGGRGGGKKDSLWQSWLNLSPSTRMLLGGALAVFAVGGMKVSDMLQAKMPVSEKEGVEAGVVTPGKESKAPPLFRIKIVDRKE